ncbi:MAG: phosphoribosylformylglycinamidine cyclo-ligase [Candidatus Omnitrophica bacterium]|nr:phosphoribosylformylglycinamidine cyclo-ligase [Candidatus Omnitrophota bacterium]
MKLSYKKAGVDIDKANLFIKKIKPLIMSTKRPGWMSNVGAFAGFFRPNLSGCKDPLIVSSTDGVGTKLLIANWAGIHDTVGVDLVAMNVNDCVACGAEPLFFLDYFATGKISLKTSYDVLKGVATGCRRAGCALIGGETAELPGMYKPGEYDLAGFCVGIVDKKNVIDGSKIKKGDLILGLASTGIHSNGYSLVRKVFSKRELKTKLAKTILKPTAIYVKPALDIIKRFKVSGIAHITGGGFYDNIERLLPKGAKAAIYKGTWPVLPIFKLIQSRGKIENREMFRTFNMGIGMAIVMPRKEIFETQKYLCKKHKLKSWVIGEIVKGARGVEII